ncbi:MAG: hypothetical protein JSS32_05035 [Verrucomicrobia bacterium]|nr:hypothetical protein [Verrucomicrobiota bacterium]
MKKIAIFFLLAATSVFSDPIPMRKPEIDPELIETKETSAFTYVGVGGSGFVFPIIPDVSFGFRTVGSNHVWDINSGANALPFDFYLIYLQTSYLYFLQPVKSPYFGIGATVGLSKTDRLFLLNNKGIHYNIPITVGYQFDNKEDKYRFIQFQVTPLVTTTVTFGLGF